MCNVLFIIVLYNCTQEQCQPLLLLQKELHQDEYNRCVYLRDNTHDNHFLARTYNEGVTIAQQRGLQGIVLVDQDSQFTSEFINYIRGLKTLTDRVIVPNIFMGERRLSPFFISIRWGIWWDRQMKPTEGHYLSAINSGTIIPLNVCERVGGFNEDYPLDGLDHWFFYQCRQLNITVQIVPIKIQHSFAILSEQFVNKARYNSILSSEFRLAKMIGYQAQIGYRLRLLLRGIKWILIGHVALGCESVKQSICGPRGE